MSAHLFCQRVVCRQVCHYQLNGVWYQDRCGDRQPRRPVTTIILYFVSRSTMLSIRDVIEELGADFRVTTAVACSLSISNKDGDESPPLGL